MTKLSRNEISILNHFMKEKNISFDLQGRVRKYLEYVNHHEIDSDKLEGVLKKLTTSMKREVLLGSNGTFLKKIPFFSQNFSSEFIEKLCFEMKAVNYSPEEAIYKVFLNKFYIIFNLNKIGSAVERKLYIVQKGKIKLNYQKSQRNYYIGKNVP